MTVMPERFNFELNNLREGGGVPISRCLSSDELPHCWFGRCQDLAEFSSFSLRETSMSESALSSCGLFCVIGEPAEAEARRRYTRPPRQGHPRESDGVQLSTRHKYVSLDISVCSERVSECSENPGARPGSRAEGTGE